MASQVEEIRAFNRFYTDFLGLLNGRLYDAPLNLSEARILLEIGLAPGLRAKDLMDLLRIDRGHLSRTLTRLQEAGLLNRRRDGTDRRALGLWLTPKGSRLLSRLQERSNAQIGLLLARLSPGQRSRLVESMASIREILQNPES